MVQTEVRSASFFLLCLIKCPPVKTGSVSQLSLVSFLSFAKYLP